jgi:hypothetical protein
MHTVQVTANSDHLLGASGRGTDVLKRMLATKRIYQIRTTYFRDHLRTCRGPSHYRFLGQLSTNTKRNKKEGISTDPNQHDPLYRTVKP